MTDVFFGGIGISRDNWHKRRSTGGKKKAIRKKRKYELGRPPANTKVKKNTLQNMQHVNFVTCQRKSLLFHFKSWPVWVADNKQQMCQRIDSLPRQ